MTLFLIFVGGFILYLLIGLACYPSPSEYNKAINNMQYQVSYYARGNSVFRKEVKTITVTARFGDSEQYIKNKAHNQLKSNPDYLRIKEVLY